MSNHDSLDALDTPVVLVDLEKAERNLKRAQDYADQHGMRLRPHIKTHKLPYFAKQQLALGAIGITCQKLGEAEVMADAGITDIFLPYNILGAAKLARLRRLNDRLTLAVTADSATTIEGYSDAFKTADKLLTVLVECDTGAGRCGVQSQDELMALARQIDQSPGLVFGGLMTYPPRGSVERTNVFLTQARDRLTAAGLPPAVISNGGSPDLYASHGVTIATEHRPGTYIYMDRMQVAFGVAELDDCALSVLATVVSRPTPDRAILDTGSKSLAADLAPVPGHGHILGYPDAVITQLSEEHATVDLSACTSKPVVGERVRVIPNHACVVTNLFDEIVLLRGGEVVDRLPVLARGKLS